MREDVMKQILKMIAKDECQDEEAVYSQMQKAIDEAYYSEDPDIKKRWKDIPHKGERPIPEEVIEYLVEKLQ